MINDNAILENIMARGQSSNLTLTARIEAMLKRPRVLDSCVPTYKPLDLDAHDIRPYGLRTDFMRQFSLFYRQQEAKPSIIEYKGVEYSCSYEVLIVFKTVASLAFTKDYNRYVAADTVFRTMLSACKDSSININDMINSFHGKRDYWVNEIVMGVLEILCDGPAQIEFFLDEEYGNQDYLKFYDIYSKYESYDDFELAMKEIYRKAAYDQNFDVVKKDGKIKNALNYALTLEQ